MELLDQIRGLEFPAPLPATLLEVEQRFDAPRVTNLVDAVRTALDESSVLCRMRPGASVAVGVGSRGIANLPIIVKTVIDCLRASGMRPFIFPAMGSHGGATTEGQMALLAGLGISPDSMGVEIRATMEVIEIGQIPEGPPLFQDMNAAGADHTLLINRVKPHTDFHAPLESGLTKMCVIGMGKQRGAALTHVLGAAGFQRFLTPAARIYEANTNLIGGLAIVENAHDETADVVGFTAAEIGGPKEVALQQRAKSLMASLPFPAIDILVVRQVGKHISGTGMDTNVLGRLMIPRQPEPTDGPDVGLIVLLDVADQSCGNAAGIGLANVTTARVVRKVDWVATYTNAITSGIFGMQRTGVPITMADDRRALQVAVRCCGKPAEAASLVFIEDTLRLDRIWVSPHARESVEADPRLSLVREVPLAFRADGAMDSPWQLDTTG
jgi:hypothetical protein